MGRRKRRTSRRTEVYRKRLISRKVKTRKVRVVTRKEQPYPKKGEVTTIESAHGKYLTVRVQEVPSLKEYSASKGTLGGPVSSSWIILIEWNRKAKKAYMETKSGLAYHVFIPFKMFEEWYYAHSKGTYFNYMIKDKFKVERA